MWIDGAPATAHELAAYDDLSAVLPRTSGQFAVDLPRRDGGRTLVRDPLGVNKLFFAISDDHRVYSANFIIDLVRMGFPLERIWSVPSGHWVAIRPEQRLLTMAKYKSLAFNDDPLEPSSIADHAAIIRRRLVAAFSRVAEVVRGSRLFVTLSGGLDSTTIAVLTKKYIGDFTAVTFSMRCDDGSDEGSEDLHYASLVADHLGVPIERVFCSPQEILPLVDVALVQGQDWRDFNLHCALVNATIGAFLAKRAASTDEPRPVVLTGDTMNELMADYSPVCYRGAEYYSLPRLPPSRLRRFLVSGLDSGDREIGVFRHFGLDAMQPYALLADAYAALPAGYMRDAGAKQRLVRAIMGDMIPAAIYARPKVRAQVGGAKEVGGTLATLIDAGLTGDRLRDRFAALFGGSRQDVDRLIKAGFYRFTTEYPLEGAATHEPICA